MNNAIIELHAFYTEGEEFDQPAWWRVDLGASYDVYQVVIFNRETQKRNHLIVVFFDRDIP